MYKLRMNDISKVRILRSNGVMFLINKKYNEDWMDDDIKILKVVFENVGKFEEGDLVIQRIAKVDFLEIPINIWVEDNLKIYTKNLIKLIGWEYQSEERKNAFSPVVKLVIKNLDPIYSHLRILVKGKYIHISSRRN